MLLTPPMRLTWSKALAYVADDELVEVTPKIDPAPQAPPRPARAQARVAQDRLLSGIQAGVRDPVSAALGGHPRPLRVIRPERSSTLT